jgi:N-methylhydantoinase A
MARALRRVTVAHGVDARSCTLLAFGGAGPMHAVTLAREFGIQRVIVPRFSGAFSALGCLTAQMSYAEQRALHMLHSAWDREHLTEIVGAMQERLSKPLLKAGHTHDELDARTLGLLRYAGQSDTVGVPIAAPFDPTAIFEAFKEAHWRLYGFATDEPWQLDSLRVTVAAPPAQRLSELADIGDGAAPEPRRTATCRFEDCGAIEVPFFDRDLLPRDWRVQGPAIVEDPWSTIVIEPNSAGWADERGHLQIELDGVRG